MRCNPRLIAPFALALLAAGPPSRPAKYDPAAIDFFEKKVRPVLVANCFNCHSADTNSKGGLRVDDRNGLLTGGNKGPAVVPGKPEKSLLLKAMRHEGPKMPLEGSKLSDAQIAAVEKWIRDGAAWPAVRVPVTDERTAAKYARLRKSHWAWQPLQTVKVPDVRDARWASDDIDRFILARLEAEGIRPVADAERTTLIRRVTFDLTGLPPTAEEIDAFVGDASPDAYERVVDRLLSSPGFGERWGRHWLDLARYGESTGSARNLPYPHAWRYRDYVIAALDADKPYDRFVREQLAGDLLAAKTEVQRQELQIATGFLAVGVKDVNQRFKVRYVMDNIDEQIDTVSRALLGLTASCARCHDHKFDPIPQKDYYALAGIFHSTDLCAGLRNKMGGGGLDYYVPNMLLHVGEVKIDPSKAAKVEEKKKAAAEAKAAFEKIRGTPEGKALNDKGMPKQQAARQRWTKLQNELTAMTDPAANGTGAMGVREAKAVCDTELRVRGEAEKLGPKVPRGFLSLLDVPDAPKVKETHSGRLELAAWVSSEHNPLTPRVMANRVWHHLFGAGLVRSVDNFGTTGDRPSHPELLDHLAARFVREGWSVKKLVRAVVLSRTYRLGPDAPKENLAVDPGNRLVWRHSPRRLSAEEMRDATLLAAGTLERVRPAGSAAMDLQVIEMANTGAEAKRIQEASGKSLLRGVYLPLVRGLTPATLEAFDPAEQGFVSGGRDSTTVAPQALFLLNAPFVKRQAQALAGRLLRERDTSDEERIQAAYRAALGRVAAATEVGRATAYLSDYEAEASKPEAWASFCQALFGCAEFRYVR